MVKISSSEEENTEFLGSLWDSYKYYFLIGLVSVVTGILGWEFWLDSKAGNQQKASDLYEAFIEERNDEKKDAYKELNQFYEEIINTFPNTLYADLVSFHLAKLEVEKGNFSKAEKNLRWIIEKHSSKWSDGFDPIEVTARQRLARVLIANKRAQEAINLLNSTSNLDSTSFEIRGDAQNELGLIGQAKVSYLQAIESTNNQYLKSLLKMKLADLKIED